MFILLFLSISLATVSHAGQTWLHVVGINESNQNQNYETFYRSADSFNKACSSSKSKANCTLFINDDPSLARIYDDPNQAPKNFKFNDNAGKPEYASVMQKIKDSVFSGKPGDTIVISLDNHGAPWRSASCIWINSKEQICDADLKAVLEKKPKGVKVVISADACFSGAFTELSSPEICTMTAASRYAVGYVAGRGIWNAVNERFPKTLADLKEPIIEESGKQKLLGSQVILQDLCVEARKNLSSEEIISHVKRNDSYNAIQTDLCRDADNSAATLTKFSKQVLTLLGSPALQNCRDLKAPDFVCKSIQRLKSAQPELKNTIARSLKIQDRQKEVNESAIKSFIELQPQLKRLSELLQTLPSKEQSEITESLQLGIEPDWSKFKSKTAHDLKLAYEPLRGLNFLRKKNDEVVKETDEIYERLKKNGLYEDLMNVQNCLNENGPIKASDQGGLDEFAKKFKPRKYTITDYEDAKRCESSISF